MKTTLEMPDDLFRKAKAVAALRGQSLKDFVTELLRRELDAPAGVTRGTRKKAADKFGRELDRNWKTDRDAAGAVRDQRRG
jgi:plasmid stability protein